MIFAFIASLFFGVAIALTIAILRRDIECNDCGKWSSLVMMWGFAFFLAFAFFDLHIVPQIIRAMR